MTTKRYATMALGLVTATVLMLPPQPAAAASGSQDKPAAEQARPVVPLKVTVVISRHSGDKQVGNLPFVLTLNSGQRTNLRMGADVPIPQSNLKEGTSYSYRTVGTQIDAAAGHVQDDGRVSLQLTVSDTQISVENSADAGNMRGLPRIHTFTSSATLTLRDGQTMQYTADTDKITGEVIRVEVTLATVK